MLNKKPSYIGHFTRLDARGASKQEYISHLIRIGYKAEKAETLYRDWMGLS